MGFREGVRGRLKMTSRVGEKEGETSRQKYLIVLTGFFL